jgi:hypothetical protein
MGFDLISLNPTGQVLEADNAYEIGDIAYFRVGTWGSLLRMAYSYGWEPAGTQPGPVYGDSDRLWDGDYFTNSGQVLTNEDAAALADALERALLDIPDHEIFYEEEDLFTTINPEMQA